MKNALLTSGFIVLSMIGLFNSRSFNADDNLPNWKKIVDWGDDDDDYEDVSGLEDYIEEGEYLIKYNEGELKLNWGGGHWMDFNDAWTDKLWKQINPKTKKMRSFKTDSTDLGNCSKCGKLLSPWDIDIGISSKDYDNSGRVICKTCRSYFMAADYYPDSGYWGSSKYYKGIPKTPRKIIVMPLNWPINNELLKIKEKSKKKEDKEKENYKKPDYPNPMNRDKMDWGNYYKPFYKDE